MADCHRAAEIEWDAYLADPTHSQWESFRSHFPGCPDCSVTVSGWSRLEEALRAATSSFGATHPQAEDLLRFQQAPGELGSRRAAVQLHLDACAPCRDSLTALASFDFDTWATATAPASAPVPRRESLANGLSWRIWLDRWMPGLPAPVAIATAISALALIGGAAIWSQQNDEIEGTLAQAPVTEEIEGTLAQAPVTADPTKQASAPTDEIEEAADRAPAIQAVPETGGERARQRLAADASAKPPEATPLREAAESVPDARPAVADPLESLWAEAGGAPAADVQLAMASLGAPQYGALTVTAGPGRVHDVLRAGLADTPDLRALAPDHVGRTFRASPTLYWFASAASPSAVVFTLVEDQFTDAILELELGPIEAAGVHAVSLAERGIELAEGRRYQWFVAVAEPDDDGLAVIAGGSIARLGPDHERAAQWAAMPPVALGHRLARDGYWYDAVDLFSHWQADGVRRQLLQQAGLSLAD